MGPFVSKCGIAGMRKSKGEMGDSERRGLGFTDVLHPQPIIQSSIVHSALWCPFSFNHKLLPFFIIELQRKGTKKIYSSVIYIANYFFEISTLHFITEAREGQ